MLTKITLAALLIAPTARTTEDPIAVGLVVVPETHSAIVSREGGALERLDLATEKVLAKFQVRLNIPDRRVKIRMLGSRLIVVSDGSVAIHDATTLEKLVEVPRPNNTFLYGASPAGNAFLMRVPLGAAQLFRVTEKGADTETKAKPVIEEVPLERPVTECASVAFSLDGENLAVMRQGGVDLYSVADGEFKLTFPASFTPRSVGFYGSEYVLVGWGEETEFGPAGVNVYPIGSSKRIAVLSPGAPCPFGGKAQFVTGYPDLGLVVFSVSSAGVITAYHAKDWSRAWERDFGGGNPSSLIIRRTGTADVGFTGGMTPSHVCQIELATGKRTRLGELKGLTMLQATSDSRYTVGVRDGTLVILPKIDKR